MNITHQEKNTLSAVLYSLRFVTTQSPKYVILKVFSSLFTGLMTPILTYLSAQLITQIGNIHGSDTKQYYFLSIAIISAQILLSLFIGAAKSLLFSPWLAKESILIEKSLTELFNAKMTRIRMQCFNNPEFVTEKDMANKKKESPLWMFNFLLDSFTYLLSLVGLFGVLFAMSWQFCLIVVIFSLPSVFLSQKYAEMREHSQKIWNARKRYQEHIGNLLRGTAVEEVKIWNAYSYLTGQWKQNLDGIWDESTRLWKQDIVYGVISSLLSIVGSTTCICLMVWRVVTGRNTVGDFSVLITLITAIQGAISSFGTYFHRFISNTIHVNYVRGFIENEEYEQSSRNKTPLSEIHEIRFDHVYFSYNNDETYALRDISFTMDTDQIIAFAGRNGSGKTTLVKLLCGIYAPTKGTIYYNGLPHTEVDTESLFPFFSVVYQQFGKYRISFQDNITFGKNNDPWYNEVLTMSKCDTIAQELGNERLLGTAIYLKASNLSQGQWQRLALARAFYKKAPYFLSDEPSSALDPIAERNVYDAINNYQKAKVKITISHRLSYMRKVDRILLLENGMLLEDGTFPDLISRETIFKKMYDIQAAHYPDMEKEE